MKHPKPARMSRPCGTSSRTRSPARTPSGSTITSAAARPASGHWTAWSAACRVGGSRIPRGGGGCPRNARRDRIAGRNAPRPDRRPDCEGPQGGPRRAAIRRPQSGDRRQRRGWIAGVDRRPGGWRGRRFQRLFSSTASRHDRPLPGDPAARPGGIRAGLPRPGRRPRPPGRDQGTEPGADRPVPRTSRAYLAEARILARLDHPAHRPGPRRRPRPTTGSAYVVSKFIEGSDLAGGLRQGRPSFRESAELVASRRRGAAPCPYPRAWSTGTSSRPTS